MTNFFFLTKVLFGLLIFFPGVMLEIGSTAYTQVRLIHSFIHVVGLAYPRLAFAMCCL